MNTLDQEILSDNAASTINPIELEIFTETKPRQMAKSLLANLDLNLIGDVKVQVNAVVGDTEISLAELLTLKEGSTLKLNTLANAPINLFLNQKCIASGELVVVDEHFGIRITAISAEVELA